jgi:hypothetical protein
MAGAPARRERGSGCEGRASAREFSRPTIRQYSPPYDSRRRTDTSSRSADRPCPAAARRARTRRASSGPSGQSAPRPGTRAEDGPQDALPRWFAAMRAAPFLNAACAAGLPFGCETKSGIGAQCRKLLRDPTNFASAVHPPCSPFGQYRTGRASRCSVPAFDGPGQI